MDINHGSIAPEWLLALTLGGGQEAGGIVQCEAVLLVMSADFPVVLMIYFYNFNRAVLAGFISIREKS